MAASRYDAPSRKPILALGGVGVGVLLWHLLVGPGWQLAASLGFTGGLLEEPWLGRVRDLSHFQLHWDLWFLGAGVTLLLTAMLMSNRRKRALNKKRARPELMVVLLTGVAVCHAWVEFQSQGRALTLWAAVAACGVLMLAFLASVRRRRSASR